MMRWFMRKRGHDDPLARPPDDCSGRGQMTEAGSAREHSERTLNDVRQQQREVDEVTSSLREHRKNNHFAELLSQAFRERKA